MLPPVQLGEPRTAGFTQNGESASAASPSSDAPSSVPMAPRDAPDEQATRTTTLMTQYAETKRRTLPLCCLFMAEPPTLKIYECRLARARRLHCAGAPPPKGEMPMLPAACAPRPPGQRADSPLGARPCRRLFRREAGQDPPPSGIGKGCERRVEAIRGHSLMAH